MSIPDTFKGFAVTESTTWDHPKLVEYKRKKVNAHDVVVKVIACGVCGSDLHTIQGAWGPTKRNDLVVGHEIVGHVVAIGDEVTTVKVGQRVGIGAASSSCRKSCERCTSDNEQYCEQGVATYNSVDAKADGYVTQGGYASHAIADEQFTFPIPESLSSEVAAPLLCAGLTVFSPLVRNVGYDATGKTVGIIGIGGVGHLAVQFANAIGAKVVAISRSSSKKQDALAMGAHEFIATGEDSDWAKKWAGKFDFVLSCASGVDVDLNPILGCMKFGAPFVTIGVPTYKDDIKFNAITFFVSKATMSTSLLGSRKEALKMLEIAAAKNVKPWITTIDLNEANIHTALTKVDAGDVRYRYVFTGFDKAFA